MPVFSAAVHQKCKCDQPCRQQQLPQPRADQKRQQQSHTQPQQKQPQLFRSRTHTNHLFVSLRKKFSDVTARKQKTARRQLANTHKDNNEIPLRAREVLPGNRKDFSNYRNLLFYSHDSLSSGMRRCHRCNFTTFPIRRKPIYLGIEILLDQHNRGNCEVHEEPHKSYLRLVDDFQKCFLDCVCQF